MATSSPSIKDFSRQEYSNPLFPVKRKTRGLVVVVFLALTLIGGTTLFLLTPWLNIREYQIRDLQYVGELDVVRVIDQELDQKILRVVAARHRYFLDLQKLRTALQRRFDFEELNISLQGSTVMVKVRERPTGVLLTDRERHVFADLTGKLSREATLEEIRLATVQDREPPFLMLTSESAISEPFGTVMFDEQFLKSFQSLKLRFEVETGLKVARYVLPRPRSDWIKVVLIDKREVYLDAKRDSAPQIRKLLTLMQEKGTEVAAVSYIDLRFPDRVYYK